MQEIGLISINTNFSVFIDPTTDIIVILYINDILITDSSRSEIQKTKNTLNAKFKISDLGLYSYYLDMTVTRNHINRILRLG